MFFYRARKAEPIELTDQFTPEETARITRLHRQFNAYPFCFKLQINYRRLEFARWLVEHGYLDEWRESQLIG